MSKKSAGFNGRLVARFSQEWAKESDNTHQQWQNQNSQCRANKFAWLELINVGYDHNQSMDRTPADR